MPRQTPQSETSQPTAGEIDQRVLECRRLLAAGARDGEVKREVAARFGLSPRTVERYLRRARDELVIEVSGTESERWAARNQLRAESYDFYATVRDNRKVRPTDRLKAQERIDRLLGLESPQKITITDDDIDQAIEAELGRLADGGQAETSGPPPTAAAAG